MVFIDSGKAKILEEQILIPASSVKGALRHRLAFHYNVEAGHFIDKNADNSQVLINEKLRSLNNLTLVPEGISSDDAWWDETIQKIESQQLKTEEKGTRKESENDPTAQNPAVKALFGYAADQTANTDQKGQRGNVLFSDVFLKKENAQEKIFDHVRIDRFTGGASDGALFQEKTVDTKAEIILEMWVAAEALKDAAIYNAWHATLDDLCEGRLPLGGKTTKGHGYFSGTSNIDLKNRKEV